MPCAIGVCLVYAAFFPVVIYSVDGNSMVAVAESLVTGHGFTVPISGLGVIGRHGLYYSSWYPLLSVLASPPVAIGVFLSHRLGLPQHYVAAMFALTLSPILTAATVLMVALIARRLGATTRGSMLAALGFGFGTIALVYSRDFFADPLLALLTAAGIYFSLGDDRRETAAAGAAALLAVLAKPTGIVLGPCLGAYLLCKRRPAARWIAPLCGTAAGLSIYFVYNWIRFANPLNFGQPQAFALDAIAAALAGLLISPGRGLLWYCPAVIALVAVPGAIFKRWEGALIVAVAGAYLAEHSIWLFWAGGWSWGPRLLLPALPGLMALTGLVERRGRRLLIALTIAGFIVNSPTLISFYQRYYQEAAAEHIGPAARMWNPRYAPLFRIWGAAWRETADAYRSADQVGAFVHQAGNAPLAASVESSRTLRIVNLWWWMLPVLGIPRAAGAAVSFALLLMGLWLIAHALARAPDNDGAPLAAGS
ncbi:MAG TPA: hypothetical protein VNE82_19875 [Candidatus Binataceae bacterium]|nr:hypothetical protein [Candidatus Binataceae bacterium]